MPIGRIVVEVDERAVCITADVAPWPPVGQNRGLLPSKRLERLVEAAVAGATAIMIFKAAPRASHGVKGGGSAREGGEGSEGRGGHGAQERGYGDRGAHGGSNFVS